MLGVSRPPHSALAPVIRLWLEEHGDDFRDPPHCQALRLLCAHLRRRLCFRRLVATAENLLKRFQEEGRLAQIEAFLFECV